METCHMGAMQTHLHNLLYKQMTRKEFLVGLGVLALVILHIEPILKALTQHGRTNSDTSTDRNPPSIYGGSNGDNS